MILAKTSETNAATTRNLTHGLSSGHRYGPTREIVRHAERRSAAAVISGVWGAVIIGRLCYQLRLTYSCQAQDARPDRCFSSKSLFRLRRQDKNLTRIDQIRIANFVAVRVKHTYIQDPLPIACPRNAPQSIARLHCDGLNRCNC